MAFVGISEDLTGTAVASDDHEAAIVIGIKQVKVLVRPLSYAAARIGSLVKAYNALPLKEALGFL